MTIITFPYLDARSRHPHVRRFDLRRDLLPVADLVEMCFSQTLDADGRRYILNMRNTARHPNFLRWAARLAEKASVPFNGFVWEQDGQVVGNLSLIPMHNAGKRIYLIANVAVHPDYRRKGIAKALTASALEDTRRKQADQVWLHVRDDNAGAIDLYQGLGFARRTRRTTWRASGSWGGLEAEARAGRRRSEHWPRQLDWLKRSHPEQLHWYLPLSWSLLQPGLVGWLQRLIKGSRPRQWSATSGGNLVGTLAWVPSLTATDRLWLAAALEKEDETLAALLPAARREIPFHKNVILEIPAGMAEETLKAGGFVPATTLIWMQYV